MTSKDTEEKPRGATDRLFEDVELLAQYARERGLVPDAVEKTHQLLNKRLLTAGLGEADTTQITTQYEVLSKAAGDVTPATLRATSHADAGYWKSAAGRHLIKLWVITLLAALFILFYNLLDYRIQLLDLPPGAEPEASQMVWLRLQYVAHYLLPFTYGGLGACAYLLRVTAEKLRTREFCPDRIPEHWNRLVLGTLSGGVIVLFVQQVDGVTIAEGALGFLAGYSIDFLFETLDRVIAAILPKTGLDTVARKMEQRRQQLLVARYQERLAKTSNAAEKKLLTEIIDDLQG